jgi:hypothetical protein
MPVQCLQVPAHVLVERDGGDVVVRRHEPHAPARCRARLSETPLHQRPPDATPRRSGADRHDLVLPVPYVDQYQPDGPATQPGHVARRAGRLDELAAPRHGRRRPLLHECSGDPLAVIRGNRCDKRLRVGQHASIIHRLTRTRLPTRIRAPALGVRLAPGRWVVAKFPARALMGRMMVECSPRRTS